MARRPLWETINAGDITRGYCTTQGKWTVFDE